MTIFIFSPLLCREGKRLLPSITARPIAATPSPLSSDRKEGPGASTMVTISVSDENIGLVLGRGGRNIIEITQLTGARIKISDRGNFMSGTTDSIDHGEPGSEKSFGMKQRPDGDIEIDEKFWVEGFHIPIIFFGDNIPKERATQAMEAAKQSDAFLYCLLIVAGKSTQL
ncbi:hypothetical protein Bca52824_022514 [Brassica carinata]|uniref:K Homology domain-containing protein n=1 Tax=Brassica carinata TaxID=52824 RepID=A0A8X8AT96_BRACI|nr:hypothetical protein Bca52824_022514 [Brassica carinata]